MLRRNLSSRLESLGVETPLAHFNPNTSSEYWDSSTCKSRRSSRCAVPLILLVAGLEGVLKRPGFLEQPFAFGVSYHDDVVSAGRHRGHASPFGFMAPSLSIRVDQAVDAHTTRAPAPNTQGEGSGL